MKIQYKSCKLEIESEKRYICYRIEPSELSWWERSFKNPWKKVFKSYNTVSRYDKDVNDCLCFLFNFKEAQEIIKKYDTYEKLIDFLTDEYNKASDRFHKAQERYNNNWTF